MLSHLHIRFLKESDVTKKVHQLPEAGYKIIGSKMSEELDVGILGPEKILCQQTADGNLPEGSGNLNLIQVDILVGQTVNGLAQSNPAGMVLRVGVHEEEEVLPLTELLIGGSLDKICEMCKLVEQDKADIILTV